MTYIRSEASEDYALLWTSCSGGLSAQGMCLRAGAILQCTLHEPNFSSRTAKIGDPLICYARPLREFGRLLIAPELPNRRSSRVTGNQAG